MKIPRRLDELLPAAAMEKVLEVLQQPDISHRVREAFHKVGLSESAPLDKVKDAWQQARGWLDSLTGAAARTTDSPTALNATGQLLPAALDSLPCSPAVAYAYSQAASHFLSSASRQSRADAAAADALGEHGFAWLASTAEAVRLVASSTAGSEGIVISRADAVRIPGLGDVRAMLPSHGNRILEIGAANGVSPADWQGGLTCSPQLLLLTSPNSLSQEEAARHRAAGIAAARGCGARVVELLADGVLHPGLAAGLSLPLAQQRLASGAQALILPLHLLLGAPSGALVIGEKSLVAAVARVAESTGANLRGPALAAATMALQLSTQDDTLQSGIPAQLLANPQNLRDRARRMAVQLSGVGLIAQALETEHKTQLGGTPWNRYPLTSWAVRLTSKSSLEALEQQLRDGARRQGLTIETARDDQALLLDLRF
ncbi:MAG: hypothetical protein KDA45_14435, partial [Planctomycetales bacterium]|nr:hypothetical protein [Planctomycetales bacterium]